MKNSKRFLVLAGIMTLAIGLATGCGSRTTDSVKTPSETSTITVPKADSVDQFKTEASVLSLNQEEEIPDNQVSIGTSKGVVGKPIPLKTSKEEVSSQESIETSKEVDIWQEPYVELSEEEDIWQEPSTETSEDEDIWQEPSTETSEDEDIWQEPSTETSEDEDIWQEPSTETSEDEDIWQEPSTETSEDEDIWQEPSTETSEDEDIWQTPSVEPSEVEESKPEMEKPEDTRFAYGICKENCYVEANGETYPLYKGQQVIICFINDTTFDIMWYPITVTVSKDFIEMYPDTFIPDFGRGQWVGIISKDNVKPHQKQVLTYGICKKTCTISIEGYEDYELYKGQQVGIVGFEDDQVQISWYDTHAWCSITNIELYPEDYTPDFTRGQWAGVITN